MIDRIRPHLQGVQQTFSLKGGVKFRSQLQESETASKSVRDSRILVDSNKTPDTTVDSVTLSDSTWNLL